MSNRNKILHYIYISFIVVILVVGFGQYIYINNKLSNYMVIHTECENLDDRNISKNHIANMDLNDENDSIRSIKDKVIDGNIVTFLITLVFSVLALNVFAVQKDVRDLIEKHNNTVNNLQNSIQKEINNFSIKILESKSMFDKEFLNMQESLKTSLDRITKDNGEKLLQFEEIMEGMQQELDESRKIILNNINSTDISMQFKSLFLESLFFSLTLKFGNYVLNPKFAEIAYYMDKRKDSINDFLSQNSNFKIRSETKNDIFESLINIIRNIEIDKIRREPKNKGKTALYETLVIDLEELLKNVRKLGISDSL